jgi:hypothetical protein
MVCRLVLNIVVSSRSAGNRLSIGKRPERMKPTICSNTWSDLRAPLTAAEGAGAGRRTAKPFALAIVVSR